MPEINFNESLDYMSQQQLRDRLENAFDLLAEVHSYIANVQRAQVKKAMMETSNALNQAAGALNNQAMML